MKRIDERMEGTDEKKDERMEWAATIVRWM